MPLTLNPVTILQKLWGSQSWLGVPSGGGFQPARASTMTREWPKEPPGRRLRARLPARLPAPQSMQNRKISGIGRFRLPTPSSIYSPPQDKNADPPCTTAGSPAPRTARRCACPPANVQPARCPPLQEPPIHELYRLPTYEVNRRISPRF